MLQIPLRNEFGAITSGVEYNKARLIILLAIKNKKLKNEYVDVDRRHRGEALNYSVYDIRSSTVIIQRRFTICTKYGNSPTKDYILLQKCGNGIMVKDINDFKPHIVKLSKSGYKLGKIIDFVKGKEHIKIRKV
jgi:hypothetical protein